MMRAFLLVVMLMASPALAVILGPVPAPLEDDQARLTGWVDEVLWVDYESTRIDSLMSSWFAINRMDGGLNGKNPAAFVNRPPPSFYDPYLFVDTDALRRYAEHGVNRIHALIVLGVRLFQAREFEESLACFERVDQMDPANQRAAELYSAMVIKAGGLDDASRVARSLLDRFPGNQVIRFNLACTYALAGENDAAMDHLLFLAKLDWPDLVFHMADPDLATLRSDERFDNLEGLLLQQNRNQALDDFQSGMLKPSM